MRFKQTWGMRLFGLAKIPMLFYLSPSVIEMTSEKTVIKIPLNYRTKNHLGSMYFAALAAGADIAGGFAAMEAIKRSGKNVHLSFKDFSADFLQRAEGDTYFYNEQGAEVEAFVREVAENPGVRMNMPLHITAKCPKISDKVIANLTLTLSLKAKT